MGLRSAQRPGVQLPARESIDVVLRCVIDVCRDVIIQIEVEIIAGELIRGSQAQSP